MADTGPSVPPPPLPRPVGERHWREVLTDAVDAARTALADRRLPRWWAGALVAAVALVALAAATTGPWWSRSPPPRTEDVVPMVQPSLVVPTPTPSLVAVHVAGAVRQPGVHSVTGPARVVDAIEAAGGPDGDADVDRLNLAAPVSDGSRVYVPRVGEEPPPPIADSPDGTGPVAPGPIDLNQASAQALETLPGIGPATAAAIVSHRERHGPFESVEGLDDVAGIGPAKLDRLRDLVRVR